MKHFCGGSDTLLSLPSCMFSSWVFQLCGSLLKKLVGSFKLPRLSEMELYSL